MNKDAITFILDHYAGMTDNEKRIADHLLLHFEDSLKMSIHTLADQSGTSAAAVVRFAKALGFEGYKELRLFLAKHRPIHEDFVLDLRCSRVGAREQVEKVIHAGMEASRLTFEQFDFQVLEACAHRIKEAKRLLLFGTGTSLIVCEDSAVKFRRLGKHAESVGDVHYAVIQLSMMDEQDLVIGFSHSGENRDTCKILSLAHDMGIRTLAVTTFPGSPICRFADDILYTQTRESPLHKLAITSRASQFAVADALLMTYLVTDYDNCMAHIDRLSDNLKKI